MTPEQILYELRALRVPHDRIAAAIHRDRSAATKMLNGSRSIKTGEIAALEELVVMARTEAANEEREAIIHRERARDTLYEETRARYQRAQDRAGHSPGKLPITGPIQAGAWLEVNMVDQREPDYYAASPDPRFPKARQWLSVVRGDSMNALTKNGQAAGILEGDLVHVVDAIDIDYRPTSGDIVEVERSRFSGREREVTLKQVMIDDEGAITLWPRSTNPHFKDPIPYREQAAGSEDIEVRVRGKMLQVIRPF